MTLAISACKVSKNYGAKKVLNGVSLQVAPGEIHGLFGSNGSGKSTLLRILAGAIRPTSGSIALSGLTGYVPQKFGLYNDLSVDENLSFFGNCYGLADTAVRSGVEEALERFELKPLRKQRTGDLSHGWRQRLSLASALCHKPAVLLLDEATAGIDPVARRNIWDILEATARSGVSIVVATHFTDEAERCHRIGFLDEGALVPPRSLPVAEAS
jgi:ABC-2 type transport system ATP-binding protein